MSETDLKKIECPWASVKVLGNDPEWPFSEASLRYMIFHAKEMGLESTIKKLGARVLIHKGRLLEWIEKR